MCPNICHSTSKWCSVVDVLPLVGNMFLQCTSHLTRRSLEHDPVGKCHVHFTITIHFTTIIVNQVVC